MPELYVSGPVIRQSVEWDLEPWVKELYLDLANLAKLQGKNFLLPNSEPQLERSTPSEFVRATRRRIASAKAVVSVFTAGDLSAAVETTIASVSGKKILLVAEDPENLPRLIEGLPGVVSIIGAGDISEHLTPLVDRLLDSGSHNGPTRGPRRPR